MHPDEAVAIAIQDLRSHLAPVRPTPRFALLTRSLWRRYLAGWTWYARDGREAALPADGARLAVACCGGEGRVSA